MAVVDHRYEDSSPNGTAEEVLRASISKAIEETREHYEGMRFREGLKTGFFTMLGERDHYRDLCIKSDRVRAPLLWRCLTCTGVR